MSINLVNLRRCKSCIPLDRRSVLGNPFLLEEEGKREEVCIAHNEYLLLLLEEESLSPKEAAQRVLQAHPKLSIAKGWRKPSREAFFQELNRLRELAQTLPILSIGCWCAPKKCHLSNYLPLLNGTSIIRSNQRRINSP